MTVGLCMCACGCVGGGDMVYGTSFSGTFLEGRMS